MARTPPAFPLCPSQTREGEETESGSRLFTALGTPGKRPGSYQPGFLAKWPAWVWSWKECGRRWPRKEKGDRTPWWGRAAGSWDDETRLKGWGAVAIKPEIEAEWAIGRWRTRTTAESPDSRRHRAEAETDARLG